MTDKPFEEWSTTEMSERASLVEECRELFGIQAARELMEKLGFPVPPPELVDPLPPNETRH